MGDKLILSLILLFITNHYSYQMYKMIAYRRWGYLLLVASLSCIFAATLSPFKFVMPEGLSWQFIIEKFHSGSYIQDYWQNILLFIPFGISLAAIITRKRQTAWITLIICFVASAILSTTVESLQLFLPIRVSNLTDIICNSFGGILGGILYCWNTKIIQFISVVFTNNYKKLNLKSLFVVTVGYCSIVILAIWLLLISVNLTNWGDDYYLAIGNEVTGDRPWHGYINSLYISDRNLNFPEVVRAFEHTHSFFSQLPSLITALVFLDEQKLYRDSGDIKLQLPVLEWQKTLPSSAREDGFNQLSKKTNIDDKIHQNKSLLLNSERWLKTKYPATSLIRKLKTTSEFSLSLIVATNQINQVGPARIIALSEGIYAHNLIVGQDGTNLIVRLRTPITGNNGTQPEFIIPNVFSDRKLHQILITFYQNKLNFYIDSANNQYSFEFKPATSFLAYLPWRIKLWQINLQNFNLLKYRLSLYGIIFIPLLILIAIFTYSFKYQKKYRVFQK